MINLYVDAIVVHYFLSYSQAIVTFTMYNCRYYHMLLWWRRLTDAGVRWRFQNF
jgi:hypothetical protein